MHGLMATGMYRLFDNSPVSMALFSLEPLKSVFLFFYPFASKLGYRKIVIRQSGDLRVCEDSIIYTHTEEETNVCSRDGVLPCNRMWKSDKFKYSWILIWIYFFFLLFCSGSSLKFRMPSKDI